MKNLSKSSSSSILVLLSSIVVFAAAIETDQLGETSQPCHCDVDPTQLCEIDGYVGNKVIYEDDMIRVWNFTLAPGEMTSMHKHDFDYHFIALQPTQLEVYGEDGTVLFDFRAEGTLGFKVVGDYLEPINIELPWPVPVVHAAKNIGTENYYEILFETKHCDGISEEDLNAAKDKVFGGGGGGGTTSSSSKDDVSLLLDESSAESSSSSSLLRSAATATIAGVVTGVAIALL